LAFNISEIRAQLSQGGARPSFFMANITNPIDTSGDLKLQFMLKATSIPEWTVGVVPVPYFGRDIKLAGTRKVAPWNVTVINDNDFLVRNAFERWQNAINSLEGNINTTGGPNPLNYKSQGIITQYDPNGQEVRIYQFEGIFPSTIGEIQLDWSNGDAIEEFAVTFQVDTFRVVGGRTGDAGGV